MKKLALALALFMSMGCAIKVSEVSASVFKRDSKEAARTAATSAALAEVLLQSGSTLAQAEDILRAGGTSADEAKRIVAIAAAKCKCGAEVEKK